MLSTVLDLQSRSDWSSLGGGVIFGGYTLNLVETAHLSTGKLRHTICYKKFSIIPQRDTRLVGAASRAIQRHLAEIILTQTFVAWQRNFVLARQSSVLRDHLS